MTNDELKKAFFEETPVKYDGITYVKINAIIYRRSRNGFIISAELLDRCKHSVMIAEASKIEGTVTI